MDQNLGNKWMSFVPDIFKLYSLTLPGTHNSCAFDCSMFGKCQKVNLLDQLNHGIRYVDVRCRHVKDEFLLHHGPVSLNLNFDSGCLDVCIEFLKSNPSETIVILISTEHRPIENKLEFDDVFCKYIESKKDYWYLNEDCPILGNCRGKIVLLRRFYSPKKPLGIDMSGWQFNSTFSIKNHVNFGFHIQDECDLTAGSKWLKVKNLLDINDGDQNVWSLNYCSAQRWPIQPPRFIAWRINKKLLNYFKNEIKNDRKNFGAIIIDFATEELVKLIYTVNLTNKN